MSELKKREEPRINPQNLLGQLTRKERYGFDTYDLTALERLEMLIQAGYRSLEKSSDEIPEALESELRGLEEVLETAEAKLSLSYLVGILSGAAAEVAVGVFLYLNKSIPDLYPLLMCVCVVPFSVATVGHMLSRALVFGPMADNYIQKKVKLD